MFKQIFRLTFFTFIWKKYKRIIVSTTLLFVFFWFVNFAHAEYLSFAGFQSGEAQISLSFFIKWFCLLVGTIIYVIYHFIRVGKKPSKVEQTSHKKVSVGDLDGLDPFDAIRQKDKLRTRAEIMLESEARGDK